MTVPRSWTVYDLSRNPRTCVRFDRHALYLGTPGAAQRCPAHLVGRTEAILLAPLPANGPRAAGAQAPAVPGLDAHATSFVVPSAALAVTATWSGAEGVVAHALHRSALPPSPGGALPARVQPRAAPGGRAHAAGAVYTGLGFDACAAPSQHQMSAWGSSPYRAIGVYIGGVNAACAQPNLTTSWVSNETAAGWHLIPTYVGLQAPSNSCGCASITPSQAASQGAAAARSAVSNAANVGLAPGNPIYYDMEAYTRGGTNTSAVMSFLSAWTSQLHAQGYLSGVYSSGGSGITDLVNRQGTGYLEPDDVWIADWNGQQTTSDPYVPASDWSNHQRLHQYSGGHDETHGGVTINIDNDYLNGATADTSSGSIPAPNPTAPSLTLRPLANGTTEAFASWTGTGVSRWTVLAGFTNRSLTPVVSSRAGAKVTMIAMRNAAPYFAVQAVGAGGQVLGVSPAVAMPAHISLFGPTTFTPVRAGFGSVPVACSTGGPCRIKLTLRAGRTVIAKTGSEYIGPGSGGLLYYNLTAHGRALLRRASGNRLLVRATARDASGATATMDLSMIGVFTTGRGPIRRLAQSSSLRIANATAYVSSRGGVGGLLATCPNAVFCRVTTTVTVGGVVIAHTGPEYLGANELGYLIFRLTARGQTLLRRAAGNQLAAQVTITTGDATAAGNVALTRFT